MSLRDRLLLATGVVALVALGTADLATYSALRSFLYGRIDRTLTETAASIGQSIRFDQRGQLAGALKATGAYVELRGADGQVIGTGGGVRPNGAVAVPAISRVPGSATYFFAPSAVRGGPRFRVRSTPLLGGNGVLLVALPVDDVAATLARLRAVETFVTLLALAAAVGVGAWLVRVGLRPLADVETTADAIARGELGRRVPGDTAETEVGAVARALNTMLGRIEDAFGQRDATEDRLRRFISDASHELRTPIAAVSAYAELFDRGAGSRPDDLARVMSGIRVETARMGGLVDDLLLLARLDEGRPLDREPVDLVAVATEAVDAATAVGPRWPVRLDATGPVHVTGDAGRLRQVLDNLLANVRAHTPPGTMATVRVAAEEGGAVVEVADSGPGLTEEEQARVFERFYRADPSRSREHGAAEHGGSGLGLAIVAAIVGAHGGRVSVEPASGDGHGGALFAVHLPA